MTMRIFFDVDGVVLDFEKSFLNLLKKYFNLVLPETYKHNNWSFSDIINPKEFDEAWNYFLKSDEFENISSLVDPELFNQTFRAYPVHFITNIPKFALEKREKNLYNLGYEFESVHCAGLHKYDINQKTKSEEIKIHIKKNEKIMFVDDHPDNCLDIFNNFPKGIIWLMDRPHNRKFNHPNIKRAFNWDKLIYEFNKNGN